MPATNYTPILLYRTATASTTAPAAGNLNFGELAINYNASGMILYAKNASGSVIKLMNNPANLLYPTADGLPNQAIVTNGSGTLSFASVTTSPGGSTTQIQYNNAGAFGGSANFVFDGTNVGIGTSSPANIGAGYSHLEVNGSITGVISVSAGGVRGLSLSADNSAANIQSRVSGQPLLFFTNGGAGATERMRITSAGLVGIGTSTPNTFTFNNLVVASGSANAGMAIYGTGQTTLAFATATSGSDSYRGYIQYTGGGTDTMTFGTVATERMRIDSSGKVGIGVTPSSGSGFSQRLQIKQADGIYSGLQIQKSDDDSILGVGYWTTTAAFSFVATYTSTGSYQPISFVTSGTERMRIDSAGSVGVGVTPSAWNTVTPVQVKNASFAGYSTTNAYMLQNAYYASGWKYISNGGAARFEINGSSYEWSGAASGTAGNAITFTPILTVDKDKTLALQGGTSAAGTGIAFPATQSASSDANTLDDYEEGTWTPTYTASTPGTISVSYGTQTGRYTKIGRVVCASFALSATFTKGTASGDFLVGGLPFTSANITDEEGGAVTYSNNTFPSNVNSLLNFGNSTSLYVILTNGSSVGISTLSNSTTYVLRGMVTYTV